MLKSHLGKIRWYLGERPHKLHFSHPFIEICDADEIIGLRWYLGERPHRLTIEQTVNIL